VTEPVICFGQQPCGILPKRFLQAKILSARALQERIGGRIVFFYHDSDHDLRETVTILRDLQTDKLDRLNFGVLNKIQKKYTPLYAKEIQPEWQECTARRLPRFVKPEVVELFASITETRVADFCLAMYRGLGLLDGMEVARSSDPAFRCKACQVDDVFVDVTFQGEIVRARCCEDGLRLHRGGEKFYQLGEVDYGKDQVSPSRDSRLLWMQSVLGCTHYVAGASEMDYLDCSVCPEITFLPRQYIEDSHLAYVP
jgi:hypothetical protein